MLYYALVTFNQGLKLWVVPSGLVAPNFVFVANAVGLVANAVGLVASCYVDLCMLVS